MDIWTWSVIPLRQGVPFTPWLIDVKAQKWAKKTSTHTHPNHHSTISLHCWHKPQWWLVAMVVVQIYAVDVEQVTASLMALPLVYRVNYKGALRGERVIRVWANSVDVCSHTELIERFLFGRQALLELMEELPPLHTPPPTPPPPPWSCWLHCWQISCKLGLWKYSWASKCVKAEMSVLLYM